MTSRKLFIRNNDPNFWQKHHSNCNCGAFALDTPTWVTPYGNDDIYTDEERQNLIQEMMDDGFDRESVMEAILMADQESILRACPWIEPVLANEIRPEDKVVAYRLHLDSDTFYAGEIDDDYHFRVRINGFWFEKCGQDPIRFCGTFTDEAPWRVTPYLVYDSDIIYFRYKK